MLFLFFLRYPSENLYTDEIGGVRYSISDIVRRADTTSIYDDHDIEYWPIGIVLLNCVKQANYKHQFWSGNS